MDVDEQFRSKKCVTNNKEYTMKKQGFTLIELMVVIVIMGILAAVAVPKLFGMIAKSKASEVPTAAGTWINLQDAYITEKAEPGDWNQVGYTGPGQRLSSDSYKTQNFLYQGGVTAKKGTWSATSKVVLNECKANTKAWNIEAEANAANSQGQSSMKITIPAASGDAALCVGLTPSFTTLAENFK